MILGLKDLAFVGIIPVPAGGAADEILLSHLDSYIIEDGFGLYNLEDNSGHYILESDSGSAGNLLQSNGDKLLLS